MKDLLFDVSCFEPLFDEFLARNWTNGSYEIVVRNVVERAFDVSIEHPFLGLVGSGQEIDFPDGIMATSAWSKPVADPLEPCFPGGFKGIFDHCLKAAINHNGDSKRPPFVLGFRNVDTACWFGFPEGVVSQMIDHPSSRHWGFKDQLVHSGRVLASIDLRYSPNTDASVRVAFQHEFLERAHLLQVALLCCPKDTLSQVTNSSIGFAPGNARPRGLLLGSVCREGFSHLTFPSINSLHIVLWVMHQNHVSRLSAWVLPYLPSYDFLLPFGEQPSLLGSSCSH
jgi:hypothetical protein